MQIIVVHPKLKKARTITIRRRWVLASAAGFALLVASATGLLSYVALRHAVQARAPFVQEMFASLLPQRQALIGADAPMRQKIDALAVKLGEIQARLARLDAIGERVAGLAGVKPADLPQEPGRGGPLTRDADSLSINELAREVDRTMAGLDERTDLLDIVESELVFRTVSARLLPTSRPVADGFVGSRFGTRIDPFTGHPAVHEGIDFAAGVGSPIVAAGSGVVVEAGFSASYGNHVDIDHGGGLVTRYAHASKLLVKEGDIVKQGQRIALVGSTGRSTGAHLHFEVRVDNVAQDPLRFLQSGSRLVAQIGGRLAARHGGGALDPLVARFGGALADAEEPASRRRGRRSRH